MMNAIGVDLCGRRGMSVETAGDAIGEPVTTTKWLPTAILPMHRSEQFKQGMDLEAHRRGRGLPWPPESQVPVMNKPANGIGRLPMAAVYELLVASERSWGRLDQTHVVWSPDGRNESNVDLRRLIAQTLVSNVPVLPRDDTCTLGLVVPPMLQPAGQELIVDACQQRNLTAYLVPSTIGAALAWARGPQSHQHLNRARTSDGDLIGHIVVLEAGLGPWIAARIPILAVLEQGKAWLVPVRNPRLHRILRGPTGWQILTAQARSAGQDWLPRLLHGPWLDDLLSGKVEIPREVSLQNIQPNASGVASLRGLEEGRSGSLDMLIGNVRQDVVSIPDASAGPCLGCIVTGPMAQLRVAGISIADVLVRHTQSPRILSDLGDPVRGAGWAALGYAKSPAWPTWREVLEPIEIYFVGKDDLGDPASKWLPLIQSTTIAAGSEYRNERPIRDLALDGGGTKVRLILRHERDLPGTYDYRIIHTKTVENFTSDDKIPLDVHVHARAGQGFAVVKVTSRQDTRFATTLDWLTMQETTEPQPPKLGYIPKSIQIKADLDLYRTARKSLEHFSDSLAVAAHGKESVFGVSKQIEINARAATKDIQRVYTAKYWELRQSTASSGDIYLYYGAIARDGSLHPAVDDRIIQDMAGHATAWVGRLGATWHRQSPMFRRCCAYLYWKCPRIVLDRALRNASSMHVDPADLRVLGLATRYPSEFEIVYRLIAHTLVGNRSANNYLRALRDIVRLNDTALSYEAQSEATCAELTHGLIAYLRWATNTWMPNVIANCVESMLYMLKRRRYDPAYMSKDQRLRADLDVIISLLETGGARPTSRLSNRCRNNIESLQRFLAYEATQDDIINIVGADEEVEDPDESDSEATS